MGLIRIEPDLLAVDDGIVLKTIREFFDRVEPLDVISGEVALLRVEKSDLGIIFNDDTTVMITARYEDVNVIGTDRKFKALKIIEVNGINVNTQQENPSPKQEAKISTDHRSQGSGGGVKSKG